MSTVCSEDSSNEAVVEAADSGCNVAAKAVDAIDEVVTIVVASGVTDGSGGADAAANNVGGNSPLLFTAGTCPSGR